MHAIEPHCGARGERDYEITLPTVAQSFRLSLALSLSPLSSLFLSLSLLCLSLSHSLTLSLSLTLSGQYDYTRITRTPPLLLLTTPVERAGALSLMGG
jgi:hypothetical protein